MWNSCNFCANFNKKYNIKPSRSSGNSKATTDTCNQKTNDKQNDSESIITLVDLWPDLKDSTNNEAVKNDPKIKYITLWDGPTGWEEIECEYHKIPVVGMMLKQNNTMLVTVVIAWMSS